MKKTILLLLAICAIHVSTMAQQNESVLVSIKFKNSSWLPKKFMLISYAPGETSNGTEGCWLMPGGTKKLTYKEGTKLYLANERQVDVVMSGKSIGNDKPFRIIKKEDNNQIITY